jgi:predicted Zn-dependent peptidase
MKHKVEVVTLPNGAKGLLIDVPDATVMNFDFNFRAGDYLSPAGKWDVAHILEHMVQGANKRFEKSSDFSKEFCRNGAYYNASTGTYDMSYEAECADFEAERILDLFCLTIEAPLLLKSEFLAEKSNIKEELKGLSNNHFWSLSLNLGAAMGFCEINYVEREKMLVNINLADVKKHYKNTHVASNLRFFIAGNISGRRHKILDRIKSMTLAPGTGRIDIVDEKLKGTAKPLLLSNPTVENVYYRWETVLDHVLTDPEDYASAALLGTLLGTMHSRIFGRARELGMVYSIHYGKYRTKNNQVWWIGGQVSPDNIYELFKLMSSELKSVARGNFTQKEIEEARQYALGNFQRSAQTVGQLLGGYYGRFVYEDQIEDYDKVPDMINAVTKKQVIESAKMLLNKNNPWGLGFYGATAKIKPDRLNTIIKNTYI